MSTRRASPGGFCNPAKLPKGPNGRALCRRCSTEVPKGRQSFCSDACIREWKIRTQPAYARRLVLARDRGVCAGCGVDCLAAERKLRELVRSFCGLSVLAFSWRTAWPVAGKPFFLYCEELGLRRPWRGGSIWQADHVVPVVEGGGECGLENLRTLCTACHNRETKALAGRRAALRRAGT